MSDFPAPDAQAQAHGRHLLQKIRAAIRDAGGSLPFDRFMQMALYEPGLGYYSGGLRKFGEQGDFVTAPEVSSLFSRTLARSCKVVLQGMQVPEILEFGAGTGTMAADILLELESQDCLPVRYAILELSADLQRLQQQTLREHAPHLLGRVEWLQALPTAPFTGVVLANEVLDAMPVHLFRKHAGGFQERHVCWSDKDNALQWCDRAADEPLRRLLEDLEKKIGYGLEEGYQSELSSLHGPWLRAISALLERGVVYLVDYGYGRAEYFHPDRSTGTLMCHYRHRAHDNPLILVGLQDITAYVDFTSVAEAATDAKLDVLGYTSQAAFLMDAGIADLLMREDPEDVQRFLRLSQQMKTLTLPSEMGERFKVLCLGKNGPDGIPGFRGYSQLHRL
jgi:SAM-dependent MidA family methyltransferase